MAYRWRPSASQRRAFAERMQDPQEQKAYDERKQEKKETFVKSFGQTGTGSSYVPTQAQHDYAVFDRSMNETSEHDNACNMVAHAFACNQRCDHHYIHVVNELRRKKASRAYE